MLSILSPNMKKIVKGSILNTKLRFTIITKILGQVN